MKEIKVAVVGATGMVGLTMIRSLEERNFPVGQLIPAASYRSVGKMVTFRGADIPVVAVQEAMNSRPDFALFSAGGAVSLEWAPRFAANDTIVIDNSSAWRMDKDVPLVVPEINARVIGRKDRIIANPNCSTIQMVMALAPLHIKYTIKRIVVSTYQSVTGTGVKAYQQLQNEIKGIEGEMTYPHTIFMNCIPHCDQFTDNDYTKEEMKLINETRKILEAPSIAISATSVRVPVVGGHSESVNVEFHNDFDMKDVRELLSAFPGVIVLDDPLTNQYPMPASCQGRDEVFVGRLRRDLFQPNTLNLWVVSDNLRKGAATNAVQIAEYIIGLSS